MLNKLKAEWRDLKASPPGQRFVECYQRHQAREAPWLKPVMFFAAIFSTVIGVVLVFIPGPAILFFAISAALLACESHAVATSFDKVETSVRRMVDSYRGKRKKHDARSKTRVGRVDEQEMAILRAAAEAGQRGAHVQPPAANVVAQPAPVDMSTLHPAAPPAIDLSKLHAPEAPAAPIDMSKLQVPLVDTREIHAQAIAQANLSRHQAEHAAVEPQPPAARMDMDMDMDVSNLGGPARAETPAAPGQTYEPPASPQAQPAAAAAPDKRHVHMSLQAPAPLPASPPRGPQAMQPRLASTKQGTGPDQPRPAVKVQAVLMPSPRTAGTMKIWTADPTPQPQAFQNVQRVIKQTAQGDAVVVMLAPPAMIGEKKRSRPSVRDEQRLTPPPQPRDSSPSHPRA